VKDVSFRMNFDVHTSNGMRAPWQHSEQRRTASDEVGGEQGSTFIGNKLKPEGGVEA
jgi:hypothetical protein